VTAEAQERPKRRRRRGGRGRRGQGGASGQPPPQPAQPQSEARPMPTLEWLRLPVAIAFALGVVVMRVFVDTEFAVVIYVLALFVLAFAVANIVTRRVIAARRDRQP